VTALQRYPWPGNVRELRNALFQALVAKRAGDELLVSDLPEHIVRGAPTSDLAPGGAARGKAAIDRVVLARLIDDGAMNLRVLRDELEHAALELALARAGGSPAGAARLLGEVGRGSSQDPGGTVRAMLRRHGLVPRAPAPRRAARRR
jgi:DNA-binding NtrC family response regulator